MLYLVAIFFPGSTSIRFVDGNDGVYENDSHSVAYRVCRELFIFLGIWNLRTLGLSAGNEVSLL